MVIEGATPATLARRLAGSSIDALPIVIMAGTVVVAGLRRQRSFKPPQWVAVAGQAGNLVVTSWLVASRGGTPGQRLLGLRVVDAATGRNLRFQQAVLRTSVLYVASVFQTVAGSRRFDAPQHQRELAEERLTALQAQVSELEDQPAHDPKGLSDAVSGLYRGQSVGIKPLRACLSPKFIVLTFYVLAIYGPAFWSPRRQALHDRLVGAAVIKTK